MRRVALILALALVIPASGCLEQLQNIRNDTTPPGGAAKDYLSNTQYTKLIVEIDYPSGSAPNSEALQVLKRTIEEVTPKTSVVLDANAGLKDFPKRGENGKYSDKEIKAYEDANRNRYSSGDTAVLYILYVDGGHEDDSGNSRVLGANYLGSSIVMFKGNVKASTSDDGALIGTRVPERCVERAVLVHEVGHAFGLVNNGIDMQKDREDASHPKHSNNKNSVMYWAVENTQGLSVFGSGGCNDIPYTFDADDKADMRAVR